MAVKVNYHWAKDPVASSEAQVHQTQPQKWELRSIGHDTCGWRIRLLLCRLELSRPGERVGAPDAKSLSNSVEMRPDSMHGHSAWIRITCASRVFWVNGSALFLIGQEEIRRFIHEAEDFVVFSPLYYKIWHAVCRAQHTALEKLAFRVN